MLPLIVKGFAIGIAVAAPVGPVGLLCIRRSIADGRAAGFVTGLGAAVADAAMALLAAFGVTVIADFMMTHRVGFHLVGGGILLLMGIAAMRSRPPVKSGGPVHASSLVAAFFSTVALTLANPLTIASMLLLFSSLGIAVGAGDATKATGLVCGVFLGSTAWWLILSFFADWFGHRLNTKLLRSINIITGIIIAGLGLYQMLFLAFEKAA